MSLVDSKKRVADHGEVFTPPEIVEAMLDLVKAETVRIDARFLEPADRWAATARAWNAAGSGVRRHRYEAAIRARRRRCRAVSRVRMSVQRVGASTHVTLWT